MRNLRPTLAGESQTSVLAGGDPAARTTPANQARATEPRVSRMRPKPPKIRSPDSSEESIDRAHQGTESKEAIDKAIEILKDIVDPPCAGQRKLPASIRNPNYVDEEWFLPDAAGFMRRSSSAKDPALPKDLFDVVVQFSREPNERFADIDILEIAAMKGIDFPDVEIHNVNVEQEMHDELEVGLAISLKQKLLIPIDSNVQFHKDLMKRKLSI